MGHYQVQIDIGGDNAWCIDMRDRVSKAIATTHQGADLPDVEAIGGSGRGWLRIMWGQIEARGAWSALARAREIVDEAVPDLLETAVVHTTVEVQAPA